MDETSHFRLPAIKRALQSTESSVKLVFQRCLSLANVSPGNEFSCLQRCALDEVSFVLSHFDAGGENCGSALLVEKFQSAQRTKDNGVMQKTIPAGGRSHRRHLRK